MGSKGTIPEVFIIESLELEDEQMGRQEGQILCHMLKLSGKTNTRYFYIRTERELDEIIDIFDESQYRYLHISCHANGHGMSTTFDPISYRKLAPMLAPCIEDRRVFVSACEMANLTLASGLLKDTGCYSLVGPAKSIPFDTAAAFWVAFYHLMFRANENVMKHSNLHRCVEKLSALFDEPINYYRQDPGSAEGFTHIRTRRTEDIWRT